MRRLLFLLLLLPLLVIHRLALAMDHLLFPSIARCELNRPLFIVGLPRSGTTYLHRLLASQQQVFTTMTGWEALFAPALCEKYCFLLLFRLDAHCGGLLARLIARMERQLPSQSNSIHAAGLMLPEEDFIALLPYDGCFLRFVLWPYASHTWKLAYFSEQNSIKEKQRWLRIYRGILARHLIFRGLHLHYLSKNPSLTNWLPDLVEYFPNSQFIGLTRDPVAVVGSQLSAIQPSLRIFGHRSDDPLVAHAFLRLLSSYQRTLFEAASALPVQRFQLVHYEQLVLEPAQMIFRCRANLALDVAAWSDQALEELCHTTTGYRSHHQYALADYGLTEMDVQEAFYFPLMIIPESMRTKIREPIYANCKT